MATVYEFIAATATGVAGYFITTFVMQPIIHYKKVRLEAASDLIVYANAIAAGPGDQNSAQQKRVEERMAVQRRRSAELLAAAVCLPWIYRQILRVSGENPADASSELLGLSNTIEHQVATERTQKIQNLLKLPRIAA